MRRPLTEDTANRAREILREVADEYKTTPEVLRAKAPLGNFKLMRRHLYRRMRDELSMSYANIGEVCHRSEDAISEMINKPAEVPVPIPAKVKDPKAGKSVTIWLSRDDSRRLTKLSKKHNVGTADMARACVVDAIAEEFPNI